MFVVKSENPLIGSEEGRKWDDEKESLTKTAENGLQKIFQVSHAPMYGEGDVHVYISSDCCLPISPDYLCLASNDELIALACSRKNPRFKVGDKVVVRDANDVCDYLTGSIMSTVWSDAKCKESGKIHTVDVVHNSGAIKIGVGIQHFAPGMLRLATDEEALNMKKEEKSEKRRRVEN